jgi:peptide/nickel transport system substrate-binding protein
MLSQQNPPDPAHGPRAVRKPRGARSHGALRNGLVIVVASAMLVLSACSSTGAPASSAAPHASATPHSGGSLTVLEQVGLTGAWPNGFDPISALTNRGTYMDAIYGQLFQLGEDGKPIPDLATGYDISADGLTVTFHIRQGVTFSDGTPFNAEAVKFNYDRVFSDADTTSAKPKWPVSSVTTSGDYDVVLHLSKPYAPLISTIYVSNANWIASPTALKKMGDAFKLMPVGAGPFVVVSDTVSSKLVLKRNPDYWKKGLPYLDNLTFSTVANDEAALQTMSSGQGQAYEGMQNAQLLSAFSSKFTVTQLMTNQPYMIQLNTSIAPFDNQTAREAVYYATDTETIDKKMFGGKQPITQGVTAPGGLFYEAKVPGYRTYDLAKAKKLVKEVGGITVNLTATQSSVTQTFLEVLQTMWQEAGMKVNIRVGELPWMISQFQGKQWQAALQTIGNYEPEAGLGLASRLGSDGKYSGVHDPKLDQLLADGVATNDQAKRKEIYEQVSKYVSDKAYSPFLFPVPGWNIAAKNVVGPGLTTQIPSNATRPQILWDRVGLTD